MNELLSEVARYMGMLVATAAFAAAIAFGLFAGIKCGSWAFGGIEIKSTKTVRHIDEPEA